MTIINRIRFEMYRCLMLITQFECKCLEKICKKTNCTFFLKLFYMRSIAFDVYEFKARIYVWKEKEEKKLKEQFNNI